MRRAEGSPSDRRREICCSWKVRPFDYGPIRREWRPENKPLLGGPLCADLQLYCGEALFPIRRSVLICCTAASSSQCERPRTLQGKDFFTNHWQRGSAGVGIGG